MALEELFKGRGRTVEPTPRESIYYIYRFPGTGSYHLSASGYGRGYHEVEDAVRRRGIGGVHVIRPRWAQDYVAEVAKLNGVGGSTGRLPT